MSFTSRLYRSEPIINDETPTDHQIVDGGGRGLDLGLRGPGDFEYGEFASPFPKELLIPRSEWQALIQEMEETESRISDLCHLMNLPHKDQASTNFCWGNAPVHCDEIVRLQQNQKPVTLSPASVCAPIKGFRNVGGWGLEALQWIIKNGVNDVKDWPANAIDSKYFTTENKAKALSNRIVEWIECRPRNVDEMISLLLHRMPGAGGYNWWSHEVTNCDPVWLDGDVAVRIRNSWKGWGDFGFGILQGSRMLADDLVFATSARPS